MFIYPNSNHDFFILSSEGSIDDISSFFGYYYDKNFFYIRTNPHSIIDKMTAGTFVNIQTSNDEIIIQQDYFCSFGIYVYKKDDFWAISNSFLILVQYLVTKVELTFNEEFDELFMSTYFSPCIKETAVKEIEELAQGEYIIIRKSDKQLQYKNYNYDKQSINLFSKSGIALLDSWHIKYSTIFNNLADLKYEILADLSGGFDSRAALSTLFKPDIFRKVKIFSDNQLDWHAEDFEIASKIAAIYKFDFGSLESNGNQLSSYDTIINSLNTRLYNASQIGFKNTFYPQPVFSLNGNGGEGIRKYYTSDRDFIYTTFINPKKMPGRVVGDKARACLTRTIDFILNNYKEDIPDQQKLYNYCAIKNHNGHTNAEAFLANLISISPLMDPILYRFDISQKYCPDRNALVALIYTRYLPEIANIPFGNNHSISNEVWNFVKDFNKAYPYISSHDYEEFNINITCTNSGSKLKTVPNQSPSTHFVNLYKTNPVKKYAEKYFDQNLHQKLINEYSPDLYCGLTYILRVMSGYLLNLILDHKIDANFPYSLIYSPDGIGSSMQKLTPGLNFKMYLQENQINYSHKAIESPIHALNRQPQYSQHILFSPWNQIFEFRTKSEIHIDLTPVFFKLDDQELPFMVDIHHFMILSVSDNTLLLNVENKYCIGSTGLKFDLSFNPNDKIKIEIDWTPNELWLLDYLATCEKRIYNANYNMKRHIIPGSDRNSNLYNF